MQIRRKNAKWSYKDHGFVCDVKDAEKNHPLIYFSWMNMTRRTSNPEYQAKNPAYKDTWACEEWKFFSNFLEWALVNGHREGLCLDKDIVVLDNKCYSPDTCVFVSTAINNLLAYKQRKKSNLPIGVAYTEFNSNGSKQKNPYRVQFKINGERKDFGRYDTAEEAGLVYGREKSKAIIQKAETLSEEDCAKCHIDIVKAALYNHADSLEKQTQAKYGQFEPQLMFGI